MHVQTQKKLVSQFLGIDYQSINKEGEQILIDLHKLDKNQVFKLNTELALVNKKVRRIDRNYLYINQDTFLHLANVQNSINDMEEIANSD